MSLHFKHQLSGRVKWNAGSRMVLKLGRFSAWFIEIWMIMVDAGHACVHPFWQCVPLSASTMSHVTLWRSCGTTASPTSSSDPLKTHGYFDACLIALRRLPLLVTSPTASCCASVECIGVVLFLCVGAVICTLATFCWMFSHSSCLPFLVQFCGDS